MEKRGKLHLHCKKTHKFQKHAHVHTYSLVCCQRSTGCSWRTGGTWSHPLQCGPDEPSCTQQQDQDCEQSLPSLNTENTPLLIPSTHHRHQHVIPSTQASGVTTLTSMESRKNRWWALEPPLTETDKTDPGGERAWRQQDQAAGGNINNSWLTQTQPLELLLLLPPPSLSLKLYTHTHNLFFRPPLRGVRQFGLCHVWDIPDPAKRKSRQGRGGRKSEGRVFKPKQKKKQKKIWHATKPGLQWVSMPRKLQDCKGGSYSRKGRMEKWSGTRNR